MGGLLCSADGQWPNDARQGEGLRRIRDALDKCGIQLWELYGHGPPSGVGSGSPTSFMWTPEHAAWEANHPPPLDPIGDQSVQAWRQEEKKKLAGVSH